MLCFAFSQLRVIYCINKQRPGIYCIMRHTLKSLKNFNCAKKKKHILVFVWAKKMAQTNARPSFFKKMFGCTQRHGFVRWHVRKFPANTSFIRPTSRISIIFPFFSIIFYSSLIHNWTHWSNNNMKMKRMNTSSGTHTLYVFEVKN